MALVETGGDRPGPGLPVEIHTLGRFAVHVDGAALDGGAKGPRKPYALLKALIAAGGQGIATEPLIDSLWPDSDGDRAQQAFRTALYRLRDLLGREALLLSAGRLSLNPDRCWVDADAFTQRLEAAGAAMAAGDDAGAWNAVEAALALYDGPFLEGEFDPPEILTARERLHGAFLRQVGAVAELLERQGQVTQALELYRRGLERDPLAEPFCLGFMRACRRQGRHAEALAAFERLRDLLERSLGAAVSPEAEALHRELAHEATRKPLAPDPQREPEAGPPPAATPLRAPKAGRTRRQLALGIAGVLVLVLAGAAVGGFYRHWSTRVAVEALRRTAELPLPEEPSLAVLPFASLSADASQAVLADAIGETIATDLATIRSLFVIAYSSTVKLKGEDVDAGRVARELGVRYVLRGSVQREADRLRVAVQLVDAATGRQVWADRYDRTMGDLFAVQDEISQRVVTEMEVKLTEGEQARTRRSLATDPEAYTLYARGLAHFRLFRKEDNRQARALLQRALTLDPKYPDALGQLGWTHWADARYGWSDSREQSLNLAEKLAREALARDPRYGTGGSLLSYVYLSRRQFEPALANQRKVLEHQPNRADANALMAGLLLYDVQPKAAIPYYKRAMRLSPHYSAWYLGGLGEAYRLLGRHDEAHEAFRKVLQILPNDVTIARVRLVALNVEMGRMDEARAEADRILSLKPRFSVNRYGASRLYRDPAVTQRLMDHLRQAGLPD